jgi:alanine-glyoxylate transaminase/(R)-3-amino-2-methylpropionate-pyruvate transaminase
MDAKTVREKHARYLFPAVINYYAEPLVIDRGAGPTVWDKEGREYLDFFGGILTVSVGHCDADITTRIMEQLTRVQHTSTLYPNEAIVALAEKLSRATPGRLSKCFFTNSGTEADETAVMMAQLHTGHQEVIALRHGYSGRSLLAMSLTAHASWRAVPTAVPGIKHAHSPYCYRCALGLSYPACDLRCARDIEELILTETSGRVAALLAEPIQGVGGFITPPPEYFKVAVEIVRRYGGLFICDEVQTGFGRTGGKMWGIEHFGVEPEMMTMAKGIANGLPMGATVATDEVADSLKSLSISTFGGNPISSVAALATIEVIENEGIVARSAELGAHLRAGLEDLARQHPVIGEVRGMGLMLALELVEDRTTRAPAPARAGQLMERAREQGLLLGKGGLYGNVIRIAPPMRIGKGEVDEALVRLGRALAAME